MAEEIRQWLKNVITSLETTPAPLLDNLYTRIFFSLFIACLIMLSVYLLMQGDKDGRRREERMVYWGAWWLASIFLSLASLPNWTLAIEVIVCLMAVATASAWWNTPYLTFRGKIHALHVYDPVPSPDGTPTPGSDDPLYDPAPDAYGGFGVITAKNSWWILVVVNIMCVLSIISEGDDKPVLMAPLAGAAVVLSAVVFGHADASWGYSAARGQRIQLCVAAIITAGAFGILYLLAYRVGKRWPWRSKRSGEYLIHPRFRNEHR